VDRPERIDGAYLAGVDADDKLPVRNCSFISADFSNSDLTSGKFDRCLLEHANFTNADLGLAQFSDAKLAWAQFSDANLPSASFFRADLFAAQFDNAYLSAAEFPDASLPHADFTNADISNTDFHNADVSYVNFLKADIFYSKFHDANLTGAQFSKADLFGAQLPKADLSETRFPNANLTSAKIENTDARYAYFGAANLQEANLTGADLRGAKLINTHLDQTVLSDARIDANTDFGDAPDEWGPTCVYETHPEATEPPGDRSQLEAAEWVYRRLQKLHEENALSEEARGFHVRKEEARRQLSDDLADNDADEAYDSFIEMLRRDTRYSVSTLQWHLTRHGESIRQIFVSAGVLILACGLLYPFVGGFESSANDTAYRIPLTEAYRVFSLDGVATLLQGIYFSIITFTTIGYGDLYPTGTGSKVLVGFESLAGAILIALFVFVLGRQVAR
jgi:uncharacterized protein YjbI with pentapeptide repeats